MTVIRQLAAAELDSAAGILAGAFHNGALYRWLEPRDGARRAFLTMIFRSRLAFRFESREARLALVDGAATGIAVWEPPASASAAAGELPANTALLEAVRAYDGAVYERWQHFHHLLFPLLDAAVPQPRLTLAPLAVLPAFQGRGVGSALLRDKLDSGGAGLGGGGAAVPFALATLDSANLGLYEHHGFQVAARAVVDGGLCCWVMRR